MPPPFFWYFLFNISNMWQSEFWKNYTYEAAHNFCLYLCLHLVKTSMDCTSTLHCSRALQKGDSQGIVRKRCVSSFTCVRTSKQCTPAWWRRCCVWVKSLYQYTNYGLERFQSQSLCVGRVWQTVEMWDNYTYHSKDFLIEGVFFFGLLQWF